MIGPATYKNRSSHLGVYALFADRVEAILDSAITAHAKLNELKEERRAMNEAEARLDRKESA